MTKSEKTLFSNLLFAHKRILTLFQEIQSKGYSDDAGLAKARQSYFEMTDDVFLPLQLALDEDKPIEGAFNAVLLHSHMVESQVRRALKRGN